MPQHEKITDIQIFERIQAIEDIGLLFHKACVNIMKRAEDCRRIIAGGNIERTGCFIEDGRIICKFSPKMIYWVGVWARNIRMMRERRDQINDDSGSHRIKEEVYGKLAEIAIYACGPILDIENQTDRFSIDLDKYDNNTFGHECDMNNKVTVKTCSMLYACSWMAAKDDPIVSCPTDETIILCTTGSMSIEIFGIVKAADLYGRWRPTYKLPHKLAVYLDGYEGEDSSAIRSLINLPTLVPATATKDA